MKTASKSDQRFWDRLAAKYASQPISDQETYEQKLAITRKYLTPKSSVFEFGCGTGSTALLHAPYVDYILATDLAQNMLDVGRVKAAEADIQNVDFQRIGIEEFDPDGHSFDVVLGLNILHLCRDPEAVTKKVHALLKPGGYFIQSTVCLKDGFSLLRFLIPAMKLAGKAPHVTFLSKTDLDRLLDEAGFEQVESFYPDKKGITAHFIVARKR
ncbi:class I SAM-dependent methyltransferase [Henriciella barbarensis]|uniref:Class I SAM-dependent methyltransferase n=1 Tax=Henriciella barbarensis TaxID=86342 RepID=A0A399QUV8_9PROT|nr:class I SAM-dependent methyltransferase [Henriciella barbarensis]RIJ21347.1 class I SAM-dependent methyltransferase [Henriciella barbarensis]